MAIFLFFLILIFIVLPLALLSRLFGGLFGIFRRATNPNRDPFFGSGSSSQKSSSSSGVKRRKKIFSRNDGEYVDFEEIIEGKSATGSSTTSSGKEIHYEIEDQVSDAEWTEITFK